MATWDKLMADDRYDGILVGARGSIIPIKDMQILTLDRRRLATNIQFLDMDHETVRFSPIDPSAIVQYKGNPLAQNVKPGFGESIATGQKFWIGRIERDHIDGINLYTNPYVTEILTNLGVVREMPVFGDCVFSFGLSIHRLTYDEFKTFITNCASPIHYD